ncbi:MAG TPA: hypothetical protein VGY98_06595 [Verrucomicrobiae bacterium]|nr:hypothetical protein [Verrucomicrobiae bacterium]
MGEHFLKDFVAGQERQKPEPWYNPDGDCIIYQMSDEAVVAERVDDILTIYNSAITGKSIGYELKGVRALARNFGWRTIVVECKEDGGEIQEVSVTALLLAAYEQGPKTIGRRKAYAEAFDSFAATGRMRADDLAALFR